jgi:hypothetical protein
MSRVHWGEAASRFQVSVFCRASTRTPPKLTVSAGIGGGAPGRA